ncbi:sperm-associated antigen 1 isoform X2 [Hemicordylus capensis]|uniref:sperm-associated antigen 1 isoform X2 n=1 Tax=Hemicordylus capensis TaxID=884348 RepID=UPI002303525D|nr:sperm-associated antigen 1 isoform X2 [Hemicordylus capensis]XP_053105715.1 sperm-associated antigen 1 isoform X2 [Hemicordylus capensis]XP_053105716.1 sperm-associated antigen 1 isoform X2 [Hemicordylus capensis]XP_053105717.1 sperm-associated antigen 1 isoform X2 [Hemicordylus capensis]
MHRCKVFGKDPQDIKSWITEMKEEEYKIRYATTEVFSEKLENLPPVRSSDSCPSTSQNKTSKNRQLKKNIPRDYSEWDKFDVEKECSKIDGSHEENNSKASFCSKTRLPKTAIDTTGMTTKEKNFIANREKEKGNEAFITGDYKEAVVYYIRSISAFPTVAAYNNKAQAEIKLQNWHVALQDCETVLKMDSGNIKALMRRATVYSNLQNFKEAANNLKKVLQTEPENAIAKKKLSELEEKLTELEVVPQNQIKVKRIFIEDIEESDGEGGGNKAEYENGSGDKKTTVLVGGEITSEKIEMGNAQKKFPSKGDGCKSEHRDAQKHRDPSESSVKKGTPEKRMPKVLQDCNSDVNGFLSNGKNNSETGEVKWKDAESSSTAKSSPTLCPPTAATLKAEGNDLFKNGQFGEAMLKYSEAIENAISSGIQNPEDLSILYSNRAACYLKEGNCVDCIQDCNSALELHPYSLKPLLRRAMAYESMERYRQAYVDYKTLLQIDSGIQAANDSINRITKTLIDQDGPNWREKLSPIPVVPVSAQLHWWDGGGFTSQSKQKPAARHRDQQPQIPIGNPEEKFKTLKNKGNEFVKKGKYEEALMKYNECMKLNSQECTIYTNRALCFLKMFRYEEAKKDCDYVLQRDGSNKKALYRRALAYKGLQNYKASIDDLNKVLLIDPSIDEAKKELQEITQLFKLKNEAKDTSQQKQRKKIEIQEVNECEEEKTQTCASADVTLNHHNTKDELETTVPLNSPEKLTISQPSNAYEFGQVISILNANKDISACAELLMVTEPKELPRLLSNKLEGDVFLLFIQALQSNVFCQDLGLAYQHLLYLSKAERFKMVLSLLGRNEVEQVQKLFDSLSKEQNQQFSLDDLESLKKDFEL